MNCRICSNSKDNKEHIIEEMMFGYRDKFTYLECGNCGCLEIKDYLTDISKYYPNVYYSFKETELTSENFIKRWLRKMRASCILLGGQTLLNIIKKVRIAPAFFEWLVKSRVNIDSRILDVGCGKGHLLLILRREGFKNLTGIDPYLPNDFHYGNGLNIYRKNVLDVTEKFDLIMLHHSFEHMPRPLETLKYIHDILQKDGCLLIRMPVIGYAWKYYGVKWAQIDAPRHFYVHTVKSIEILSEKAGFKLFDVSYDSNEFQFWASAQYIRNIPLMHRKSYWVDKGNSVFSKEDIKAYRERAKDLNKNGEGDQACFYFRKR